MPLPLRFRLSPGPGKERVMGAVAGGLDTGGGGGMEEEDKELLLDLSREAEGVFCRFDDGFEALELASTSRSGTVTSRAGVRTDRSTDGRR